MFSKVSVTACVWVSELKSMCVCVYKRERDRAREKERENTNRKTQRERERKRERKLAHNAGMTGHPQRKQRRICFGILLGLKLLKVHQIHCSR